MISGWKGLLVSAIAGGLLAFALGVRIGGDSARNECERQYARIHKAAADLIQQQVDLRAVAETERDQARSEVEKVNVAVAEQVRQVQRTLLADKRAREDAAIRLENAAKIAAREAQDALARAEAAREVVKHAQDPCTMAVVPADVRGVLDAILRDP